MRISRRFWLGGCAVVALAAQYPALAQAAAHAAAVPAQKFSFDWLQDQARALAARDYAPTRQAEQEWLHNLGYDAYRDIRFVRDKALWSKQNLPFRTEFFHLGSLYLKPVQMYEVVADKAQPIDYKPSYFSYGHLQVPPEVAEDSHLGYAGIRMLYPLNRATQLDELFVFLGASYFRALGKGQFYGLSARGLALDTASARGEEFPDFTSFWLERPNSRRSKSVTVYALLDSPSVAGAYRFVVTPGENVTMEVSARLYARQDISKLGVAPLTSMYAHGENNNRLNQDFRPEVHDSDGLLIANSNGEWLWRPTTNPLELGVSTFSLPGLKGFGLLQRDRDFDNYQDIEAHYEARPSAWVEPKGDWGPGAVQLVEIPTDSEIHDNIVAYWIPKEPLKQGQSLSLDYTLTWGTPPAGRGRPLQVASSHVGLQNGVGNPLTKFVIDFVEPDASRRGVAVTAPKPELWSSIGEIMNPILMPNPHSGGWRVVFDLKPDGNKIHELRCVLRQNGKAVSEVWSYQWRS